MVMEEAESASPSLPLTEDRRDNALAGGWPLGHWQVTNSQNLGLLLC